MTKTTSVVLVVLLLACGVAQAVDAPPEAMIAAARAYQSGDFVTAARLFRPLAVQGDAEAQFMLGLMYHDAQGFPQDYVIAANWVEKAAEQGLASAQGYLGYMYTNGQGLPLDTSKG